MDTKILDEIYSDPNLSIRIAPLAREQESPEGLAKTIESIRGWHYDRNLIHGSSDKDQYLKLCQEMGELSDSICKKKNIEDGIGDIIVVLINIATRNGLTITQCLSTAYNDIKDRKGRMVDGVFVKEFDNG